MPEFDPEEAENAAEQAGSEHTDAIDRAATDRAAALEKDPNNKDQIEKDYAEAVASATAARTKAITDAFKKGFGNDAETDAAIDKLFDTLNDIAKDTTNAEIIKKIKQSNIENDANVQEVYKQLNKQFSEMSTNLQSLFDRTETTKTAMQTLTDAVAKVGERGETTEAQLDKVSEAQTNILTEIAKLKREGNNPISDNLPTKKAWFSMENAVKLLVAVASITGLAIAYKNYMNQHSCMMYLGENKVMINVDEDNCSCVWPTDASDKDTCIKNLPCTANNCGSGTKSAICIGNADCTTPWDPSKKGSVFYTWEPPSLGGFIGDVFDKGIIDPANNAANDLLDWLKQLEKPFLIVCGVIAGLMILKVVAGMLSSRRNK